MQDFIRLHIVKFDIEVNVRLPLVVVYNFDLENVFVLVLFELYWLVLGVVILATHS